MLNTIIIPFLPLFVKGFCKKRQLFHNIFFRGVNFAGQEEKNCKTADYFLFGACLKASQPREAARQNKMLSAASTAQKRTAMFQPKAPATSATA